MKVIFLDIDGCLTSEKKGTYFNLDPAKYHPSKTVMKQIMKLCDETGAKVVLSSNWRKFDFDGHWINRYGIYKNPIGEVKKTLEDYCIDVLPKTRHINKSQALVLWLEIQETVPESFVIFDDDLREQFQNTHDYGIKDHFILVDTANGITEYDISKAKDILNSKEEK